MSDSTEVKKPETTGAGSSTAEKSPTPSSGEVKKPVDTLSDGSLATDEKIPYEKFKKVVDEKNEAIKNAQILQEVLAAKFKSEAPSITEGSHVDTSGMDEEQKRAFEWRKYIDDTGKKAIEESKKVIQQERERMFTELKLEKIQKDDDFPILRETFASYCKANPNVPVEDAYDLVKYRVKRELPREEERIDSSEATTGSSLPSGGQSVPSISDLVYAKNPDGSYKYSLSQLEEMLPKG